MPESASLVDRLKSWLLAGLPQHAVSRVVHRLARWETPASIPLRRWFVRRFGVEMMEAAETDPARYPSFNAFFTRALRPGLRPVDEREGAIVSPVDGRVSQVGAIREGRIIQAKGRDFSLAELLGEPAPPAAYAEGRFITLYLSPGDYHRIHMPVAGRLQRMTHIPGRLFPVAGFSVRSVPRLFARNERLVSRFELDDGSTMEAVWVGAINVGSIETVWAGEVTPGPGRRRVSIHDYPGDCGPWLDRGQEAGRFNLGSTVILVLGPGVRWEPGLRPGSRVRVGERIGWRG